ncbi:UDP-glucose--hexose-1-phosphate uridylyltransferase [Vagococcus vulneris]|uniref:Galactose-1-phosphate uridylyltransferase n=1 Tax=Vagococcus vulneris TaxID=1977869 RepID=A0A429ZYM7_9ENTE|nr:UDP-glucose--hexose-1-phosphate uridylyltransferase [Vagococcus vulneris]RST99087.1 UDP-glucose--hexose-1-phosphate uridylyltransferase [Vagococcus vulneris]
MTKGQIIYQFVSFIIESSDWTELDRIYLQNRVLAFVGETEMPTVESNQNEQLSYLDLLQALVDLGVANQVITDLSSERDILESQLMDLMTPSPSKVNQMFYELYHDSPVKATDYFYGLSRLNNYIKTKQIAKNIEFKYESDYGNLDITINLSKPEKDPKQIVLAKNSPKSAYPKCALCLENEGYKGTLTSAARTNHRLIRLDLAGDEWGMQYSPYAYFTEHAIFLSAIHRPMKIDRVGFTHLLQIVDKFPHYFVGSNADLPIVGGSILSHDHFQGGHYEFAMAKAPVETEIAVPEFSNVSFGIVKWPMSVVRLSSNSRQDLVAAADHVLKKWKSCSYPELDIVAETADGINHHTITPIARKNQDKFELDLVLRDNNVSVAYPDGIFHAHPDKYHIKKENIGLIEVMGLAILPPRLKDEINEVIYYLLGETNHIADYHLKWAETIKKEVTRITPQNVESIVHNEIGKVFEGVLLDAGVFKRDKTGQLAFKNFLNSL